MSAPRAATPATEPRLAPDRHDSVLAAVAGAVAHTQRLEQMLQVAANGGTVLDDDDPAVLASLGAIAVGRSLRRWLQGATSGAARPATPDGDEPLPSSDLLR
jgi:hypothetical protein